VKLSSSYIKRYAETILQSMWSIFSFSSNYKHGLNIVGLFSLKNSERTVWILDNWLVIQSIGKTWHRLWFSQPWDVPNSGFLQFWNFSKAPKVFAFCRVESNMWCSLSPSLSTRGTAVVPQPHLLIENIYFSGQVAVYWHKIKRIYGRHGAERSFVLFYYSTFSNSSLVSHNR